jgi:hypothetical protein
MATGDAFVRALGWKFSVCDHEKLVGGGHIRLQSTFYLSHQSNLRTTASLMRRTALIFLKSRQFETFIQIQHNEGSLKRVRRKMQQDKEKNNVV